MIKYFSLKNFRSHPDTRFDFSPGVNVIIGLPNKGKSNIRRGMEWLFNNRPRGRRVKSKFTNKATRVSMGVEDVEVSLVLGKSGKRYELTKGGKTKKYKAVGVAVPDIIARTINISEINLQRQLDAHYLVTESGSNVSQQLNRITRLEKIDAWMKRLNSRLLGKGKEVSILEGQVVEKKGKLDRLHGLSRLKKELDSLEDLGQEIGELEGDIVNLVESIAEIESCSKVIESYQDSSTLLTEIDILLKEQVEIKKVEEKISGLDQYIEPIRETVAQVNEMDKGILSMMEKYKKQLLKNKTCPFCPVCTTDIRKHNVEKLLEGV